MNFTITLKVVKVFRHLHYLPNSPTYSCTYQPINLPTYIPTNIHTCFISKFEISKRQLYSIAIWDYYPIPAFSTLRVNVWKVWRAYSSRSSSECSFGNKAQKRITIMIILILDMRNLPHEIPTSSYYLSSLQRGTPCIRSSRDLPLFIVVSVVSHNMTVLVAPPLPINFFNCFLGERGIEFFSESSQVNESVTQSYPGLSGAQWTHVVLRVAMHRLLRQAFALKQRLFYSLHNTYRQTSGT